MKRKCYTTENGQIDTAGKPIIVRICYCGTTACQQLGSNDYPLPKDFNELCPIDRPCPKCGVPKIYDNKNYPNH